MQFSTSRLLLRDYVESDEVAVFVYQSKPRYLRYYEWTERSQEDVRLFVQRFIHQQAETPRIKFQFVVMLVEAERLIGSCGIRKDSPDARQADIGYELDPAYWGHGYATEPAQAVLRFGFLELGLHRVWAQCIAENTASMHVLERLGMQREGCLRDNVWMKGRWWDTLIYSILEDEWRANSE
jgi:RimJ/RimL family protein N-acetyltransferase